MFARSLVLALALAASVYASPSQAAEPSYCSLENFLKLEQKTTATLDRAHIFQVGQLTLAGLGVGNSDYRETRKMAESYGDFQAYEKSCTFYLNDGNDDAAKAFNHHYIDSPIFKSPAIATKYEQVISPILDQGTVNMLACAKKHGFISLGCDGMRHRGPSVFAMLLAYSGCSAANATKIANKVWGTNWVPTKTRTAIAQKGYDAGSRNPAGRQALQRIMTSK